MPDTIVAQKRTIFSRGTTVVYEIASLVTDQGDLPDGGVFTYQIVQKTDPGADKYIRVATVSDYIEYSTDRAEAVARGDSYYRVSSMLIEYNNAQVAQTAVEVLKDFVNNLVVNYQTYKTDFDTTAEVGPPDDHELLTFPLATDTLKESLENDYTTLVSQREAKEDEIDDKTDECADLTAELAQLESEKTNLTAIRTELNALNGLFTGLSSELTTYFVQVDLVVGEVESGITAYEADVAAVLINGAATSRAYFRDPTPGTIGEVDEGTLPPQIDALNTDSANAKGALNAMLNQQTLVEQRIAALDSLLTTKDAQIDAKRTAKETCAEELNVLNQELSTLTTDEAAALAALLAVCPDYTPA